MYSRVTGMIYLNVFLCFVCVESKLCGASNCTRKCCIGSNFYPLCRHSCEGVICLKDENCDGGYCCVRQCVNNSLICQQMLHISPTQSRRSGEDGDFATWEFALIILASVIAGILFCFFIVWGCRAIISRI